MPPTIRKFFITRTATEVAVSTITIRTPCINTGGNITSTNREFAKREVLTGASLTRANFVCLIPGSSKTYRQILGPA